MFRYPEKGKIYGGEPKDDGALYRYRLEGGEVATVIASHGLGWEHVSMSLETRTPTWEEMSLVKGLFWTQDDLVVQYHPPTNEYVNNHPFCLHLWRKAGSNDFCEMPPKILI